MKTVVHWFRRDLRVTDNTALHEADRAAERVVPVFCWDDAILRSADVGGARVAFLLESLRSLEANLDALGHRLVVRRGRPEEVLRTLAREAGASAIFANRDYEPYARERDARVAAALASEGVAFRSFKDSVVWEEREVLRRTSSGPPLTPVKVRRTSSSVDVDPILESVSLSARCACKRLPTAGKFEPLCLLWKQRMPTWR